MKGYYIDFHAHILPGADHGSESLETSQKQLELAKKAGIDCIIATPHFYPERHGTKRFLSRRDAAFSALTPLSEDLTILCGAEVSMCEGLHELSELESLKIEKSEAILIEMPFCRWSEKLIDSLLLIKAEKGINVILAHADRYPPKDIERLFEIGLKGQLNASAFASVLKRRRFYSWIDEGLVVALGSDVHGPGKAYSEYARVMTLLGDRGERLQTAMLELVKAGVNYAEDLPDVSRNY